MKHILPCQATTKDCEKCFKAHEYQILKVKRCAQ